MEKILCALSKNIFLSILPNSFEKIDTSSLCCVTAPSSDFLNECKIDLFHLQSDLSVKIQNQRVVEKFQSCSYSTYSLNKYESVECYVRSKMDLLKEADHHEVGTTL